MSAEQFTAYVAGFLFNEERTQVALIQKCKPAWQKGLLNGIGGKIEPGETAMEAMIREFEEETGWNTHSSEWAHFARLGGKEWEVHFFTAVGDLSKLRSAEPEEPVVIREVATISPHQPEMVENLPWLIPLALDCLQDGRPGFASVMYPPL